MCGICGAVVRRGSANKEDLLAAMDAMRSRGPDEQGVWVDNALGVGHVRLSIIDLSGGQQPMWSTDQRYLLVFNGEIYNYRELRKSLLDDGADLATDSDSEVILELYRRHGSNCVEQLHGMFSFVVVDTQTDELFLARDRMGVKPLVYARTERGFFFASTLPALLKLAPELRQQINHQALSSYFAQMNVPAPHTAYTQAFKLRPGHWIQSTCSKLSSGDFSTERYWHPETVPPQRISEVDAIDELRRRVDEAVGMRLVSERPIGAFLSGGVDSAIVVSSMARQMSQAVRTFTVGFDQDDLDESDAAEQLAKHVRSDHHAVRVSFDVDLAASVESLWDQVGEPFADHSLLPSARVACAAAEAMTVVLTGDGPDELWGGYKRHQHARQLAQLDRFGLRKPWLWARHAGVLASRLKGKHKQLPLNQLDRILMDGGDSRSLSLRMDGKERGRLLTNPLLQALGDHIDFPHSYPPHPGWDGSTAFSFYDVQAYQQAVVIPKVDYATMACSLEARSPFLDHELVEWTLSLPGELKLHPQHGAKYLLKQAFARDVPAAYFDQRKRYFSPPTANWLKGPLKDWAEDLLLTEPGRGVFNATRVQELFQAHAAGRDQTSGLWAALSFAHWLRTSGATL